MIAGPLAGPIAGVCAAIGGLSAAHLTAGVLDPDTSPVLAVGAAAVDRVPTGLKEWAIGVFGTADKTVLLGVVLVAVLFVAGASGWAEVRRRGYGVAIMAGLSAVAALAVGSRPNSTLTAYLPLAVAFGVGVVLLRWMLRRSHGSRTTAGMPVADRALDRRRFLVGTGSVLAGSAITAGVGQVLARPAPAAVIPWPTASLTGATGITPAAVAPAGLERTVAGVSALQTPVDAFFRIDTALRVPRIDPGDWRLTIDGMVEAPVSVTFAELVAMPLEEHDITLSCVSNDVGGDLVGGARWLGVRVADLIRRAGPRPEADMVLSTSVDGFTAGTPLEVMLDGRPALLAVGMNGAPLTGPHGSPVRLVTPGVYGFVGATKWLTRLTVTRFADQQAYWTTRGWAPRAPVKTASRIDTPRAGQTVAVGPIDIGGVAWAAHTGITAVDVSVNQSPWRRATLGPDLGVDYWKQWVIRLPLESGTHEIRVRATDGAGIPQSETDTPGFPDGATGLHTIRITSL